MCGPLGIGEGEQSVIEVHGHSATQQPNGLEMIRPASQGSASRQTQHPAGQVRSIELLGGPVRPVFAGNGARWLSVAFGNVDVNEIERSILVEGLDFQEAEGDSFDSGPMVA